MKSDGMKTEVIFRVKSLESPLNSLYFVPTEPDMLVIISTTFSKLYLYQTV